MKRTVALFLTVTLTACATTPAALPPRADVQQLVEPKPRPPASILTDPAASDLHNSKIEGWGDRLSSAGKRLCAYFAATGMNVECGR